MARTVTLAALRSKVLVRAGMENTQSPTTAAINDIISDAATELYDVIRSCFGQEYYANQGSISLVAGTSSYALPTDFAQLLGVEIVIGGRTFTMSPFELIERNMYSSPVTFPVGTPTRYRLTSTNITFIPTPTSAYTVHVLYVPAPPVLTLDADTLDGVSGWDDFVTWSATATLLARVESDPSYALKMKGDAEARIRGLAERDAGMPPRVSDVSNVNVGQWWPWV